MRTKGWEKNDGVCCLLRHSIIGKQQVGNGPRNRWSNIAGSDLFIPGLGGDHFHRQGSPNLPRIPHEFHFRTILVGLQRKVHHPAGNACVLGRKKAPES